MAGQEVRAFNVATSGFSAGLVGPSRSRLQGVLVYCTNTTAFTIKNGSATGDVRFLILHCLRGGMMCSFLMTAYWQTTVALSLR